MNLLTDTLSRKMTGVDERGEVAGTEFCKRGKWIMSRVKEEVWKKPTLTAVQRKFPGN